MKSLLSKGDTVGTVVNLFLLPGSFAGGVFYIFPQYAAFAYYALVFPAGYVIYLITRPKKEIPVQTALSVQQAVTTPFVLDRDDKKGNFASWFIDNLEVELDILDTGGVEAIYTQRVTATCKLPTKTFSIVTGPADKVSDIKISGGLPGMTVKETNFWKTKNIAVTFSKDVMVNTTLHFQISYKFTDCYTAKSEFWQFEKYYEGNEFLISILFPATRHPKGFNTYLGEDLDRQMVTCELLYEEKDTRSILKITPVQISRTEKFTVTWDW